MLKALFCCEMPARREGEETLSCQRADSKTYFCRYIYWASLQHSGELPATGKLEHLDGRCRRQSKPSITQKGMMENIELFVLLSENRGHESFIVR